MIARPRVDAEETSSSQCTLQRGGRGHRRTVVLVDRDGRFVERRLVDIATDRDEHVAEIVSEAGTGVADEFATLRVLQLVPV